MLLLLPFALFGIAALFTLLLVLSSRALPIGGAVYAAFAVHTATGSYGAAALAAAAIFLAFEFAAGAGGIRLAGTRAGLALDALVCVPAAFAGWSVGALAAAWLGIAAFGPGLGAALAACLIARRRILSRPG
jgi:hypothetical protein